MNSADQIKKKCSIIAGIKIFPANTAVNDANKITAWIPCCIRNAPPEASNPSVKIG